MLANGITLGIKSGSAQTATILAGLKEVPDLGVDPEKVDNTTLEDKIKQYEFGIGDPGDIEYKFKYVNSKDTDSYRVLRTLAESKQVAEFEQTLPDGTKYTFKAQASVKLGGGGVNSAIDFTCSLALQSEITITDKAGA
jgi:hypothetical protein